MDTALFPIVNSHRPLNRLGVAAAHLEVAIAHINNHEQASVSACRAGRDAEAAMLRVLVTALADIRHELTAAAGAPDRGGRGFDPPSRPCG